MAAPAQTIGTFTEPSVAFTVPCAKTSFDQTGNPICVRSRTSRTPASITRPLQPRAIAEVRSEEHTSELQSLMRISSAVFCLQKKQKITTKSTQLRDTHSQ